ncbi:hypothetical protein WR25_03066 [Diploscapter pachys]|uniref:BPTI/Kunitz inhibitor domain-containing protein n=1 Tax=Diploscapter pachys TaxID=2018661 RepID=A0A2A2KBA5_9BILA|nr:hypothetical protein WR25_03066 [Diploscapter pachys]
MHNLLVCIWLYLNLRFSLGQELLDNPRCNHYPDRGTCETNFEVKWYYDRYDHRCRRFFYGGCDGNENRFNSLEECSAQCHYQPRSNRDRCFQPHDPGNCNADIERWFFDMHKKQCVCSYWTGCSSNDNLYYSFNHCMLICGEYAEIKTPGIDENYWGKLNGTIMSPESQRVFQNPPVGNYDQGIYSVSVPVDDPRIHSHQHSAHPSNDQKYDDALQAAEYEDDKYDNPNLSKKRAAVKKVYVSHADDIQRRKKRMRRPRDLHFEMEHSHVSRQTHHPGRLQIIHRQVHVPSVTYQIVPVHYPINNNFGGLDFYHHFHHRKEQRYQHHANHMANFEMEFQHGKK